MSRFPLLRDDATLAERADHTQRWLQHARGELEAAQREYNEAVWHAHLLLTAVSRPAFFREAYPALAKEEGL